MNLNSESPSVPYAPTLLVDDDKVIPEIVGWVLQRAGCTYSVAANGPECLRLVREGFRGVILMDIMMPGMDGWATLRALRDDGLLDGNVVCMLTAVPDPGPGNEDLAELVFDYLPKPFEGHQLLGMLQTASGQLAL